MTDATVDPEHDAVDGRSAVGEAPPEIIEHTPTGVTFWVSMVLGVLLVAYGLRLALVSDANWLKNMAAWFVAGGVLVDLFVVPVVALVGLTGRRVLPLWAWRVVRAALLVTVLLVVYSAVLLGNPGGRPENFTVRTRDFGSGLLTYLVVVWVIAAAGLVASWYTHRRDDATS